MVFAATTIESWQQRIIQTQVPDYSLFESHTLLCISMHKYISIRLVICKTDLLENQRKISFGSGIALVFLERMLDLFAMVMICYYFLCIFFLWYIPHGRATAIPIKIGGFWNYHSGSIAFAKKICHLSLLILHHFGFLSQISTLRLLEIILFTIIISDDELQGIICAAIGFSVDGIGLLKEWEFFPVQC